MYYRWHPKGIFAVLIVETIDDLLAERWAFSLGTSHVSFIVLFKQLSINNLIPRVRVRDGEGSKTLPGPY